MQGPQQQYHAPFYMCTGPHVLTTVSPAQGQPQATSKSVFNGTLVGGAACSASHVMWQTECYVSLVNCTLYLASSDSRDCKGRITTKPPGRSLQD